MGREKPTALITKMSATSLHTFAQTNIKYKMKTINTNTCTLCTCALLEEYN